MTKNNDQRLSINTVTAWTFCLSVILLGLPMLLFAMANPAFIDANQQAIRAVHLTAGGFALLMLKLKSQQQMSALHSVVLVLFGLVSFCTVSVALFWLAARKKRLTKK